MKNKKNWIYLSLMIVLLFGISFYSFTLNQEVAAQKVQLLEEKENYPEIYNILNSITLESFAEKMNNQEDFIVYVGRPTCSDCTAFEPKLIEMIKKYELQGDISYLNVAEIRKNETEWKQFKSTYQIDYTPTIAKFKKGKLSSIVNWTPEKGTELDKFEDYLRNIK